MESRSNLDRESENIYLPDTAAQQHTGAFLGGGSGCENVIQQHNPFGQIRRAPSGDVEPDRIPDVFPAFFVMETLLGTPASADQGSEDLNVGDSVK
jgi:hypothetical protein